MTDTSEENLESAATTVPPNYSDVRNMEKVFIDLLVSEYVEPNLSGEARKKFEDKIRSRKFLNSSYANQTWDAFFFGYKTNYDVDTHEPMRVLLQKIGGPLADINVAAIGSLRSEAGTTEYIEELKYARNYHIARGMKPDDKNFEPAVSQHIEYIFGHGKNRKVNKPNPWSELFNPYLGWYEKRGIAWSLFFNILWVSVIGLFVIAYSLIAYNAHGLPGLLAAFWSSMATGLEILGAFAVVVSGIRIIFGNTDDVAKMWGSDSAWLIVAMITLVALLHHSSIVPY